MGCRPMKDFWNNRWFIKVVSLLFAILLVIYIDSTQTGFVTQGEPRKQGKQPMKLKQSVYLCKFQLIQTSIMLLAIQKK